MLQKVVIFSIEIFIKFKKVGWFEFSFNQDEYEKKAQVFYKKLVFVNFY